MKHNNPMRALAIAGTLSLGALGGVGLVAVSATVAPVQSISSASAHTATYDATCEDGWFVHLSNYGADAALLLIVDGITIHTGTFGTSYDESGSFTPVGSHELVIIVDTVDGTYEIDDTINTGDCTPPPPPTDVCLTIDGIADPTVQTTVPTGLVTDGAGNCTTPPPPPSTPNDPPKTTVPGGATDSGDLTAAASTTSTQGEGFNPLVIPFALGVGVVAFVLIRRFGFNKPKHAAVNS